MRSFRVFAYLAAALLSVTICACGGESKSDSTSAAQANDSRDGATLYRPAIHGTVEQHDGDQHVDGDTENEGIIPLIAHGTYDRDDIPTLYFGHDASPADRRAVVGLVRSYYTAVAADNGTRVCSLTSPLISESLVEKSDQSQGTPSPQAETCATAMSRLLKSQRHGRQSPDGEMHHKVIEVRVNGRKGLALMGRASRVEASLMVLREEGAWKVDTLSAMGIT